jgi:HD superfamily phosphohydrolase
MPKQQRIRDPLHDLIEFNDREQVEGVLWEVIQTRPFQRLRRIKQLGFSDLVYPGATHSRLLHSVGVFHTARRLMTVIDKYVSKDQKALQALAAALLHDVGHGPFSHAFEAIGERFDLKMAHHETVSDALIRDSGITPLLCEAMGSGFANDVADMVTGSGARTIYSAVVSSQFDADRLDYMRRDRLMTGSQHAGIDFEWLVENLEVAEVEHNIGETRLQPVKTFVLGRKAIFAAEAYVLGLFQLYPTVYLHKATRGAEKIYVELLARTFTLVQNDHIDKTGLPVTHPLVKFAQSPEHIECALALDDTVIWGALSLMSDAEDECISVLARRLRDRKLYKCIDVRAKIAHDRSDSDSISDAADKVCKNIKAEIAKCLDGWSQEKPNAPPKILVDEAERSPYKRMFPEDPKAPLNQINIRTEGDRLEDLAKRSEVVAKLGTYKSFRVYHADNDEDTKRKLIDIIDAEIRKWPA